MNNKIWIVLKSEFLRRVRSKWFVIGTILGPVIMVALLVLPSLFGVLASDQDARTIAVIDETNVLLSALQEGAGENLTIIAADAPADSLREAVRAGTYDGFLVLPAAVLTAEAEATYYSSEGGGISLGNRLERLVDSAVEERRLVEQNAPPELLKILEARVSVEMVKLTDEGEEADSTIASSMIGVLMGFFIYMAMFIYGAYVMQGVMEEKQSRVVEMVVSAVKPFQLLMGKVLGIGLMGMLQMGIWAGFMLLASIFAGSIASLFLSPTDFGLPEGVSQEELLAAADFTVPVIEPALVIWFLLFFIGGYLLYASFYAAVGAAVDNQQDAQGLMTPVFLLIIVPMMFITFIIESPNSTLATTLSLIPFFAPILMVVRAAVTDVPLWQMVVSFSLLVGGFILTIWASSRIYRVGILMYGKKPSLKDLSRWFRYA